MPTLAEFQAFLANALQVPAGVLSLSAAWVGYAFNIAMWTVNPLIAQWSGPSPPTGWGIYQIAVYNLGADQLINMAQDTPGALPNGTGGYWEAQRAAFKIASFQAGVVNTAGDQGTSDSLTVPEVYQGLTTDQVQNLKTPWGRVYIGIASKVGSNWGLS